MRITTRWLAMVPKILKVSGAGMPDKALRLICGRDVGSGGAFGRMGEIREPPQGSLDPWVSSSSSAMRRWRCGLHLWPRTHFSSQ